MSYILEALKKSQSDRELGRVPRVQGFGIDVPIEPPRSRPWAYLALLLALVALGAGGFVLLRVLGMAPAEPNAPGLPLASSMPEGGGVRARESMGPAPPAAGENVGVLAPDDASQASWPVAVAADGAPSVLSESGAARPIIADATPPRDLQLPQPPSETPTPGIGSPAASTPQPAADASVPPVVGEPVAAADTLPLADPDDLSIAPEVLVVPAPAKPGEPLPRGAEELRRAVLGDGGGLSVSADGSSTLPRPPPPDQPLPSGPPPSEYAPVPEDLLAEIDAFKKLVRSGKAGVSKQAAAAPPPLPEPPLLKLRPRQEEIALPAAPSLDLRNRLPPFSMSVHVYNPDPERRFVYINGRKLTESQESREGLLVKRVVSDGAVLSYQGEEFFQRR